MIQELPDRGFQLRSIFHRVERSDQEIPSRQDREAFTPSGMSIGHLSCSAAALFVDSGAPVNTNLQTTWSMTHDMDSRADSVLVFVWKRTCAAASYANARPCPGTRQLNRHDCEAQNLVTKLMQV